MGDLSDHFSRSEFECRGKALHGHPPHPIVVQPELVRALERLRFNNDGRRLRILSGHRCEWYNERCGGAARSQHLTGHAADIPAEYATESQAATAGFRGIGTKGRWAVHVDVRKAPARWKY